MMGCPDDLRLASLSAGTDLPDREALLEHAADCRRCQEVLADLASLDAGEARRRSALLPLAAAASLLVAMGLAVFWKKPQDPPPTSVAVKPVPKEASLELAPGGDAILSGRILIVKAGTCWLDTSVAVEMTEPSPVRFEAGSEAEIRIVPSSKAAWSLLGEAWAGTSPEVLVSVVSGSAITRDVRIPAGSRAQLRSGHPPILKPLDTAAAASIHAWRTRSLEAGSRGPERVLKAASGETALVSFPSARGFFSAEIRAVRGHLVLRYPAGETTLGNLETWKDASWHRLTVSWSGSGTEIFLDGRRLQKLPAAEGPGLPGLGVWDGSLTLREIRP